ncbi:flavin-containing monooxygenase [Plakobranchus ocellatus]|uniref:Flavin-containing monooxygenase n=1 Tax=Plakobranchus ocellatus TaxID=259542 RepID=A0AAV4BTI1_9GAST|nr:flavin-containing monooxygenase [Plakobranchus ocellatus]
MDTFQGQVMHSHDYRHPEKFSNQVLVLLGAGLSGRDIAMGLSEVATKVYLSHNKAPLESRLPHNVEERPGVRSLGPGSKVTFLDGSTADVDTVMFCTGYCYDYGFLAPECGVEVFDQRVWPVYKHLINTKFPSMAILGICTYVIPFPLYDIQVQLFRAVLEGRVTLPSEREMNEDIEADYRARLAKGQFHRHCHSMLGPSKNTQVAPTTLLKHNKGYNQDC